MTTDDVYQENNFVKFKEKIDGKKNFVEGILFNNGFIYVNFEFFRLIYSLKSD